MEKKLLFLLICLFLVSCEITGRLTATVKDRFRVVEGIQVGSFTDFNPAHMFVMRTVLIEDYRVQADDGTTTISEFAAKKYRILQQSDKSNCTVAEELYLYLERVEEEESGKAFYMSTMPLLSDAASLMLNKTYISTYSVNHVMVGKWKISGGELSLNLKDKKETLNFKGRILREKGAVLLEEITHPGLKKEQVFIPIQEIFNLESPEGELADGVYFNTAQNRDFVYHDWRTAEKKFNLGRQDSIYKRNLEYMKIRSFFIDTVDLDNKVYFKYEKLIEKDSVKTTTITVK